jgi:DNA-binding beta-propeller fold protein YncE
MLITNKDHPEGFGKFIEANHELLTSWYRQTVQFSSFPFGIAINNVAGTAIVADTGNNRIKVFNGCSNTIC